MSNMSHCRVLLYAGLLVAALSCAKKSSLSLVPAAGKVEYSGKPVANVSIQFVPDPSKNPKGYTAIAQTGADGSFRLQTPGHGDGIVAGLYKVTFITTPGNKSVPAKYTRLGTTTLVVEIPAEGKSNLTLKLEP